MAGMDSQRGHRGVKTHDSVGFAVKGAETRWQVEGEQREVLFSDGRCILACYILGKDPADGAEDRVRLSLQLPLGAKRHETERLWPPQEADGSPGEELARTGQGLTRNKAGTSSWSTGGPLGRGWPTDSTEGSHALCGRNRACHQWRQEGRESRWSKGGKGGFRALLEQGRAAEGPVGSVCWGTVLL